MANQDYPKIRKHSGDTFKGINDSIIGCGSILVTYYANHMFTMDFVYEITTASNVTGNFLYGINYDIINNTLFPDAKEKILTQYGGGCYSIYRNGTLNPTLTGYGGAFFVRDDIPQFMIPARIYDIYNHIGGWSSDMFLVGDYLIGQAYGPWTFVN